MKKKWNNGIVLKVILGVIAIIILGTGIFLYQLLRGGLPEIHNKINQYGQWENFAGYSGLKVFPKDISEDCINHYYYKSQDTIFSPEAQVFMEAVYDAEHFIADAYVCEYNWNNCYEYALVFEADKKIDYIFLQNIDLQE